MQASDIMTKNVISVREDTEVRDIAGLLLQHRISAVPVVGDDLRIVGLVSEGDLMRRTETGTDNRHAWWLSELFSTRDKRADYIKTHGRKASDIMTRNVITVSEDTPLHEIARLLESHHIKRVPVTANNRLTGIVSRANLLHGLATRPVEEGSAVQPDDKDVRERLLKEITVAIGADAPLVNATVSDGAVALWGNVDSSVKKKAVEVAAESTAGVKTVENNISVIPAWKAVY